MSILNSLEKAAAESRRFRLTEQFGTEDWLRETLAKLERAERSKWMLFLPPYFSVAVSRSASMFRAIAQEFDRAKPRNKMPESR